MSIKKQNAIRSALTTGRIFENVQGTVLCAAVMRGGIWNSVESGRGKLYFVFSKESIESLKTDELVEWIKSKKARCFPYVWQAQKDYPDLFSI